MPRPLILTLLPLLAVSAALADDPRPAGTRALPYATFRDRLRGGWAGQMAGVSYGSIYEFKSNGRTYDGPIRPWKPAFIANSLGQDDVYVEMTFLKTLETYGLDPTWEQVGNDFRDSKYELWHANMAARANLRAGIRAPDSGHPRYNPHSDDIDFQIEADLFGLIAPGLFQEAARLCDKFGRIMNHGDGLYGGLFIAAMYSQAYLEAGPSPEAVARCVDAGLKAIPADSRYARLVRDVIAGHKAHPDDWKATWQSIQKTWGEEDLCPEGEGQPFNIDAKLNGGYVVLGLLYGGADFAKTLEVTTRCGQDADCNPASAAGVLGTLYGFDRLPKPYTSGIPALAGQPFSYTDYDFNALIAACERTAAKLLTRAGGKLEGEGDARVLVLPVQTPTPPAKLEQLRDFKPDDLKRWREEFDDRLEKLGQGKEI